MVHAPRLAAAFRAVGGTVGPRVEDRASDARAADGGTVDPGSTVAEEAPDEVPVYAPRLAAAFRAAGGTVGPRIVERAPEPAEAAGPDSRTVILAADADGDPLDDAVAACRAAGHQVVVVGPCAPRADATVRRSAGPLPAVKALQEGLSVALGDWVVCLPRPVESQAREAVDRSLADTDADVLLAGPADAPSLPLAIRQTALRAVGTVDTRLGFGGAALADFAQRARNAGYRVRSLEGVRAEPLPASLDAPVDAIEPPGDGPLDMETIGAWSVATAPVDLPTVPRPRLLVVPAVGDGPPTALLAALGPDAPWQVVVRARDGEVDWPDIDGAAPLHLVDAALPPHREAGVYAACDAVWIAPDTDRPHDLAVARRAAALGVPRVSDPDALRGWRS